MPPCPHADVIPTFTNLNFANLFPWLMMKACVKYWIKGVGLELMLLLHIKYTLLKKSYVLYSNVGRHQGKMIYVLSCQFLAAST
jgi:hypothetical protein